jgi:hypothetical protein
VEANMADEKKTKSEATQKSGPPKPVDVPSLLELIV